MDKRLMLALCVTSIWGSAESVYALTQQDRLIEEKQHVRAKPSLSTKQVKRVSNGRLKLSIKINGGKSPSSLQSLKNKKLSRKQTRATRKKFSVALNASKKKGLSTLIQTKKKARLIAKRNRKTAVRVSRIERQRLQSRRKWERQEARLQARKSRLLRRNPAALNRLRTPILPLVLKAPNVAEKTVSPVQNVATPIRLQPQEALASKSLPLLRLEDNSSLLKIVAVKKTEEMQIGLKKANASPKQPVSKGFTKDLELNSENLIPFLRDLTTEIFRFVETASKDDSATLFRSSEAFRELTAFTNVVNEMVQYLNPSLSHKNGVVREGGDDGETLNDEETTNFYPQTQHGQTLTQEEQDLEKDGVFVPLAAEESDLDMVEHAIKMETLKEEISPFQDAAQQLREKMAKGGSDDIEGNKTELRKLLTAVYRIEGFLLLSLPSLKLPDSELAAESVNSLLKSYEKFVSSEKAGLLTALQNLLALEAKSKVTHTLSHSTPIGDQEDKKVHSDTLLTRSLLVAQGKNELQTGTFPLDKKDVEPEDESLLVSKPVTTDSDDLSTRSFPTVLGSLNKLLDGLVDRVDLNSNVAFGYSVIKFFSNSLKNNLLSIKTGKENKSSDSLESKQEEPYDFAADMKDLHSKVSDYLDLTLSLPSDNCSLSFHINIGKKDAVQLIKELTELNQTLEEKGQKAKEFTEFSKPVETKPTVTPSQQDAKKDDNGGEGEDAVKLIEELTEFSKPVETKPTVTPSQQDAKKDDNGKDK